MSSGITTLNLLKKALDSEKRTLEGYEKKRKEMHENRDISLEVLLEARESKTKISALTREIDGLTSEQESSDNLD